MTEQTLSGRTAIVTGSTSGIGRAIAERFAGDGANVVVNSRSQDRVDTAAVEIAAATDTDSIVGVAADVSDYDAVGGLVDATVEEFGRLDVMVNNAGINIRGPAEEMDPKDWQRVLDVNLSGVFYGAQHAGRQMIQQDDGGQIVNISSMMGEQGQIGRTPYNTSKGGVNNLTRCLAVEWGGHDVQVNAVAPGYIKTEMVDEAQGQMSFDKSDIEARTPMRRFGRLDEVANCVHFLAAGGHFVSGDVLHPDGGWLAYGWGADA